MYNISANQLQTLLQQGVITVNFTKADGTNRVMRCTLQEGYLPATHGSGQLLGETSSAHLSVWDLDANGWRSFRLDSLKSVQINGVEYSPDASMLLG